MSYESEESWYIFKPFPQWYVTIILFYVTTICCKRNQVRTREYIRWKNDLFYSSNTTNLRDLIAATGLAILLKLDSNRRFFQPCDLELWWMTSKKYSAPLPHYIKLCASSQTHRWIQTGVTVRKHSIRIKIGDFFFFLSFVTSKFEGWPWKTIGHRFYVATSFVHYFIAIGGFKLELQSGNTKFWSNSAIFFVPCDLEIWQMTLKNNRAHLLCCFKLCASFHSHRLIQTKVTVRKLSIRVKIGDFLSHVTLKFDGWPWKLIGHLFYATSSFVHHFVTIGDFKLELQSGNAQFGSKSTIF